MTKAPNHTEGKCNDMAQVLEAARPIKQHIAVLLKNEDVSYTIAMVAMTQVMMDIAVLGLGQTEQQARGLCAALFLTDDVKQEQKPVASTTGQVA